MGLNIAHIANGAVGAVPVVGPVLKGVVDVVQGLFPKPPPDGRWASNANDFAAAMAGSADAALRLKGHGGLGPTTLSTGSVIPVWPRADIAADALNKYNQLVAAAAKGSGGAATALGPKGDTPGAAAFDALNKPSFFGFPMWAVGLGVVGLGYGAYRLARR